MTTSDAAMDRTIELQLTMAEFIVLFDCFERCTDRLVEQTQLDAAEKRAFWNLDCAMEKVHPLIFSADYQDRLAEAKNFLIRE